MPKGDFSNDDDWINPHALGRKLNIAGCMVQEVMFENDEAGGYYSRQNETPEQRWGRMRGWVASANQALETHDVRRDCNLRLRARRAAFRIASLLPPYGKSISARFRTSSVAESMRKSISPRPRPWFQMAIGQS